MNHPVQSVTMPLKEIYAFGRCILQIDNPALDYRTIGSGPAANCSISCSRYIDPRISAPGPTEAWLETDVHTPSAFVARSEKPFVKPHALTWGTQRCQFRSR
jgi:hypothetical protein